MAIGQSRVVRVLDTVEPVSLAEAKNYLRIINDTEDDALITSQISAARQIAETYLSRDILPRQREQFVVELNRRYLDLFYGPVHSINSVSSERTGVLEEGDQYEIVGLETEPLLKFTTLSGADGFSRGDYGDYGYYFSDITIDYDTLGLQTDNTVKQGVLAILSDLYNGVDVKKSCFAILSPLKKKYI